MKASVAAIACVGIASILAIAIVVGWYHAEYLGVDAPSAPAIGGPFFLVDDNGNAVTDQTYHGKWLLIYFGYTFCPDACPTALNAVAAALDALGQDAARVQPLFITIDPERDTPAVMKEYVAAFDNRIVGLTGNPEQIAAAARAYRVYYRRVGSGSDYTMDHTVLLYIMDPNGRFSGFLSHDLTAEEIAGKLKSLF